MVSSSKYKQLGKNGFFKTILFLLFCCIYPLIGIIAVILQFTKSIPVAIVDNIINKNNSIYMVDGVYNVYQGDTINCGPTVNYQLFMMFIFKNIILLYNYAVWE